MGVREEGQKGEKRDESTEAAENRGGEMGRREEEGREKRIN